MMPVMAYDLLESVRLLAASSRNFEERCVRGIEANREKAEAFIEQSLSMCTALAPEIGYDKAAQIAKEAYKTGRTVREISRKESGLSEDRLNQLLDPRKQTGV
jgi:fumarate hydratase class II